jgi:hypothetical protein
MKEITRTYVAICCQLVLGKRSTTATTSTAIATTTQQQHVRYNKDRDIIFSILFGNQQTAQVRYNKGRDTYFLSS